ncbi:MAG: phosphatase PAP2 family protein [Burkholderiaceae bacterium]|nr:phosphatase PAP2 family protein [Burkholderiaceae bacterium]
MTPPTDAPFVALTEALGAHALAGFFVLLAVVLVAVAMVGVSLGRLSRLQRRARAHPYATLFVRLLLGFALIVAAAYAFAEIADEIAPGEELAHLDQVFSDAVIAHTPDSARQVFAWISHLGDPITLAVLGVVAVLALLLRGERLLALAVAIAMGGNALLNLALKHAFERARPLHHAGPTPFDGYSFPSGHSSGALVAYGMLAYVLIRTLPRGWHLPAAMLCAAAAFSVGASRIFVQAHFATDVVAGFSSGGAWLTICILTVEWMHRERHARP